MAQKKIVFTKQSFQDLDRIIDPIALNFSHDLVIKVYQEIHASINSLIKFPKMGKLSRTQFAQRELIVEKNTVFYSIQDNDIVISSIRPRKAKVGLKND
jgi:plasmid stabilization system protein ParE